MHKHIKFLLSLCLFLPGTIFGQKNEVFFELQSKILGDSDEFQCVELSVGIGYNFTNSFFGIVKSESSYFLFDIDGQKDNAINAGNAGVYLGYKVLKFNDIVIDIRGGYGGAVLGKNDWKYAYYDGGAFMSGGKGKTKLLLGFGVKFYDSRERIHKDYTRFYGAFGVVF